MSATQNRAQRLLQAVESFGNRLPHPTMLFVYLCGLILVGSAIAAVLTLGVKHPVTGAQVDAVNLLSAEGVRRILTQAVSNFTGFAPVGTVLVAVMGMGVAERSGLLGVVLRALVLRASGKLTTFLVVLTGVLSSIAVDTGYVVLVPLAAVVFLAAGRHPVAGIAAAFAGVSGGFSANLLIGPLDAILAGISTEAAQLVSPGYQVTAAGNYYFMVVSTFFIALVGTWVTERWICPMLGDFAGTVAQLDEITAADRQALKSTGWFSLVFIGVLLAAILPEQGVLRNPQDPSLLRSPFISSIVVIISLYAALCGWVFGRVSGRFQSARDFILSMELSMQGMASYLVLMFFAAQFVNWFNWSQLGTISAIQGAALLQAMNPNPAILLVGFVFLSAFINLMIGSSSAKWALIGPIFVPMLLLSGISPEAAQVAYRIGDSSTNVITPLMPYFGVVVAFVQKYDESAGIGTLLALMLPFSLFFLLGWSLLLAVWILVGIPLGPGAPVLLGG